MSPAKDESFIDLLKDSNLGREILGEKQAKEFKKRQELANQLAALEAIALSDHPKDEATIALVNADFLKAKKAFYEFQQRCAAIIGEIEYRGSQNSQQRLHIEEKLRETASSEIERFKDDMRDEWRKCLLPHVLEQVTRSIGTLKPRIETISNRASIEARISAIREAIHMAEELKLAPDQSNIKERLAAIRANLPEIDKAPQFEQARSGEPVWRA